MKQTLKRPCKLCPFRSDLPHGYLHESRVTEIAEGVLRGDSFPCHQTTVESDDGEGEGNMEATADSQQCAGAEIFCAKQGGSSQMARITERLGLPVAELDMDAPVCGSHAAMLKAHGHEPPAEDEWEACSIVDGGCEAPAGYLCGNGVIENTEERGETEPCTECGEPVCSSCSGLVDGERVCNNCGEEQ